VPREGRNQYSASSLDVTKQTSYQQQLEQAGLQLAPPVLSCRRITHYVKFSGLAGLLESDLYTISRKCVLVLHIGCNFFDR